jgi:hypothetical protein
MSFYGKHFDYIFQPKFFTHQFISFRLAMHLPCYSPTFIILKITWGVLYVCQSPFNWSLLGQNIFHCSLGWGGGKYRNLFIYFIILGLFRFISYFPFKDSEDHPWGIKLLFNKQKSGPSKQKCKINHNKLKIKWLQNYATSNHRGHAVT